SCSASSARSMQRKSSMPRLSRLIAAGPAASEPHRHYDVLRSRVRCRPNQAAAVAVRESDLDVRAIDRGQGIHQVVHVEADLQLPTVVADLDLFLGFLLLWVVRLDRQRIGLYRKPD